MITSKKWSHTISHFSKVTFLFERQAKCHNMLNQESFTKKEAKKVDKKIEDTEKCDISSEEC